MKIYLSLPISNLDEKKQREKADRTKTMLSKMGWEVINPFEIYVGANASYGQHLGADITALIDHADAIFICKGWENSHGCRIEHFVAQEMKKKVIFEERSEQSEYWR